MNGISLISRERLNTYKNFTSDSERALELHNMTMQVGSSLLAVIALIELGLRNQSDLRIAQDFGVNDWLISPPKTIVLRDKEIRSIKVAKQHAQKAQYAKLSYKQKLALDSNIYPKGLPPNIKHETLSKKRIETFNVSQGQIISQTTIFFWKRLFSSDYDATLWRSSLRKLFPQKHIERAEVVRHLESLYSARNRVAHHDPVYGQRLDQAFEAVDYMRNNFLLKKGETKTDFQQFTEIQYHRLYIDYITFKKGWGLLED